MCDKPDRVCRLYLGISDVALKSVQCACIIVLVAMVI